MRRIIWRSHTPVHTTNIVDGRLNFEKKHLFWSYFYVLYTFFDSNRVTENLNQDCCVSCEEELVIRRNFRWSQFDWILPTCHILLLLRVQSNAADNKQIHSFLRSSTGPEVDDKFNYSCILRAETTPFWVYLSKKLEQTNATRIRASYLRTVIAVRWKQTPIYLLTFRILMNIVFCSQWTAVTFNQLG